MSDAPQVVLFRSERRFEAFRDRLERAGAECTVLDFDSAEWLDFDYSGVDASIYYPAFEFSSNHPQALSRVKDNLLHLHALNPRMRMYPDPGLIRFYNDKFRQCLFLKAHGFPVPDTIPLVSEQAVRRAGRELGFPMVLKNRFGAGGESVFLVRDEGELSTRYRISRGDFWNAGGMGFLLRKLTRRRFYYHLIKEREIEYPFLSWPLLAQRFLEIDRDLKTVVRQGRVVEGHWRSMGDPSEWKMNIDGGGIGEWSHIPQEALDVSERLARKLGARWLNIDLIPQKDGFLISEFSPVWHHYRYKEKPSFVYKDDYNIPVPLEQALDLETLIVDSLVRQDDAQPAGRG